jgi:hypothetical protein
MAAGILRAALILRVSSPLTILPDCDTDDCQDPVGGAQQAGSWAVRETFVAVSHNNPSPFLPPPSQHSTLTLCAQVVVCNLPLVYQGGRRLTKATMNSAVFSRNASRMGYNKSIDDSKNGTELTSSNGTASVVENRRGTIVYVDAKGGISNHHHSRALSSHQYVADDIEEGRSESQQGMVWKSEMR